VKYPKTLLPNDVKWTADNWNPNYRKTRKSTATKRHITVQDSLSGSSGRSGYVKMAADGRYMEA
jgi:hypothetical protein